jgi:putative copper export protein
MIGYSIFTSLIYLPVLERQLHADALRCVLELVSARLRPFFGGSLLIFLVTGTFLMFVNKSYPGLGNFFANPWSAMIVIKHVLVVGFLALAVYAERAFVPQISEEKPTALKQFRWAMNIDVILGTVILLLTSLAQAG